MPRAVRRRGEEGERGGERERKDGVKTCQGGAEEEEEEEETDSSIHLTKYRPFKVTLRFGDTEGRHLTDYCEAFNSFHNPHHKGEIIAVSLLPK